MKYCDRDLIKGYSWHESFDAIATALEVISDAENLYEINKLPFLGLVQSICTTTFSLKVSHYSNITEKSFHCTQVVESLPGVDVSCNPPELSVKLLENNGKATCQWVFNLTFKVSELSGIFFTI